VVTRDSDPIESGRSLPLRFEIKALRTILRSMMRSMLRRVFNPGILRERKT
jgi:hypothetical protein